MFDIPRLDFNIAYACNLACKGCISLSDFDRKGVEDFDSVKEQIEQWSKMLNPKVITLFGGEPLLHPRLHEIIKHIRKAWSGATVRLITNGYLLKKHDPKQWFDYKPFEIQVSIHRKDHEKMITAEIKKIISQSDKWIVKRITEKDHKDIIFTIKDFSIWKSRFDRFVTPYNTEGNMIVPFKSDPAKAHRICGSPNTPVLYRNKLYKCPPIANILDLPNAKGFDYTPYELHDDLTEFVSKIGKPESICAMCPENTKHSFNHFDRSNVHVKHLD